VPSLPHPSNAELLGKLYNSNRSLEASISKLNSVSEELKAKEDQLLKTENQLRAKRKENSELKEIITSLKQLNKNSRGDDQLQKHL
jgi:uncharacterized protein (DUF3084 family)